jgi:hypothetical protein
MKYSFPCRGLEEGFDCLQAMNILRCLGLSIVGEDVTSVMNICSFYTVKWILDTALCIAQDYSQGSNIFMVQSALSQSISGFLMQKIFSSRTPTSPEANVE